MVVTISAPTSLSQTLITGVYRSGTSFVSDLLGGHPDLSATMYHVNALRFLCGRYDPLTEPARLQQAVADTAQRLQTRYEIDLDREAVLTACTEAGAATYGTLYDALMRVLWLTDTRRHWSEKCQLVWREIPEFLRMMPNGRAILAIRDPRSVLASFKSFTYATPPAYLGAIFNCLDAFQAAQRYARTLPPERFKLVRYEDAAGDPMRTRAGLFEFLGLDLAQASHHVELGTNSAFATAGDTFDVAAAILRWQKHLTPEEIAAVELVCGAEMAQLGYEPVRPTIDKRNVLKLFEADPKMAEWLHEATTSNRGIQAFPTDPLEPKNWEENRAATS